jgi:hypothetical protein
MRKNGLILNKLYFILFLLLLSGCDNITKSREYKNCLKLSAMSCLYNTNKRKNDIIQNCKIIIVHNQEISQVENFYTCKQRRN